MLQLLSLALSPLHEFLLASMFVKSGIKINFHYFREALRNSWRGELGLVHVEGYIGDSPHSTFCRILANEVQVFAHFGGRLHYKTPGRHT